MEIVYVKKKKSIKAKILQLLNWFGITNTVIVVVRNNKKIKIVKWRN